jgi:hypothetical protein
MKKLLCILMLALLTLGGCNKFDPTYIEDEVNDLKNRMTAIEQTVNSNITALQGLVAALENADFITGVTTFTTPAPGGYVISFVKGGTITISNGTAGTNGSNGTDGRDGSDGRDGADGQDGASPQIGVRQDTDGAYYWTLNGEWILAGGNKLRVTGEKGATGSAGQNGITPQLRINSGTNIWEVSYNEGNTWVTLGVKATGSNGQDGVTPQLRINSESNLWEVSYNEGNTWISLDVAATGVNGNDGQDGQDGQNGQDGVTPQIRINVVTNEWEISCDNGAFWATTGIKATGAKGVQGDTGANGDAVFATNGIDYSNSEHVEFTLSDGITKIKVPKYKKLGLNFAQPGTFAAGETKIIAYTPEGDAVVIEFLNMPSGWKANVNYSARTFAITAPATFNSNKGGKVVILISDGGENMIMRTIDFVANDGGDDGDDGGDDDGGDGDDNDGGDDSDDGTAGHIAIDGYSGSTLTVYYTDGTHSAITQSVDNSFAVPANHKIIESIALEGGTTIVVGRKANDSVISFKLSGENLVFRDAIEGYIPIGTYSEFQLINTALGDSYKQEADLDLLDIRWTPIGRSSSFSGIFDGDNHTLANLKISESEYSYAGLFGWNIGTVRNVHVISGSVSGGIYAGGICGMNDNGIISKCSNASRVSSGANYVGGICGSSSSSNSSSSITACYNTGSISGTGGVVYIGGVCGSSTTASTSTTTSSTSITACYNTGSVSGPAVVEGFVGGICGYCSCSSSSFFSYDYYSYSSITACYNIGSVSVSSKASDAHAYARVGGICGSSSSSNSSSSSITACYNTGSVSGVGPTGGICGFSSSSNFSSFSIAACYNTGSVSGVDTAGGVCGFSSSSNSSSSSIIACYWKDITDDNADYGIGNPTSNTGTTIFALGAWPITGTHTQWGTGDGSGNGKYWKSLGGWNGGNPIYPKLWLEE